MIDHILFSLVPSQAREYVESLHQNQKDVLIYGKNNVKVQPKDKDTFLPGYLSFHKIITNFGQQPQALAQSETSSTTLVLKWTPNQLMNGNTTQEKSASWQQALYIDLKTILFLHCHQVIHQAHWGKTRFLSRNWFWFFKNWGIRNVKFVKNEILAMWIL